jgi:glycosyltransferase involved in cell wall biosynthesis
MSLRIAYFINQYPKVSHTFIRREILALERQGFDVLRIALRGWDSELSDAQDELERVRTRYVLQAGMASLVFAVLRVLFTRPVRFFKAFQLAMSMGIRADRPLHFHLIYLAEACKIIPWLKEFGARHVHAHFGTNSAEVVMLAHVLGGPRFSFTVHGPDEFDKPQFLHIGEKVRRSAFVVAISSYGRSQLYRWIDHAHWHKVKVVHCGLETAFHDVAPIPLPTAPHFVCVGRLWADKGQLLLIEAVHRLSQKGIKFELVLAGDGEMRAELEELIRRYGLTDQVRITGWISSDQVREEILASRAMVMPTFAEGLPVVIMEAMALRRPVLTTYVAGIPELVRHGENGWLFPAGDVDELVAVMIACLELPTAELERMGELAHKRVLLRHDIDREAAKLAVLFQGAIETGGISASADR